MKTLSIRALGVVAGFMLVGCAGASLPGTDDGAGGGAASSSSASTSSGAPTTPAMLAAAEGHRAASEALRQMRLSSSPAALPNKTTTVAAATTQLTTYSAVTPVAASQTCPGNLVTLGQTDSVTLTGSTVGMNDNFKEWCADTDSTTSAPDVVYQVQLTQTCSFHLNLTASTGFQAAVAIRPDCSDDHGAEICMNDQILGDSLAQEMQPGTYYVVVDGAAAGQSGSFTLTMSCAAPSCGDGIVNTGEQCDEGLTPSANCGAPNTAQACHVQSAAFDDTCADITGGVAPGEIAVEQNADFRIPGVAPIYNSLGGHDDYSSPTCSNPIATGAPDQVFEFRPVVSGTLSVTIGQDATGADVCKPPYDQPGCFIHVMWFRSGDCTTGPEMTCTYSNVVPDNCVNTLSIPVTAGTPYWLFVEGNSASSAIGENGPYMLHVTLK